MVTLIIGPWYDATGSVQAEVQTCQTGSEALEETKVEIQKLGLEISPSYPSEHFLVEKSFKKRFTVEIFGCISFIWLQSDDRLVFAH